MYKDRIKFLRERYGYTQKNIADILKIDRGLYAQYEIEYSIIPIKHLIKIANYFKVSIDYIFSFTDKMEKVIPKEIDKKLSGKRIKELRKSLKLTQTEFVNHLNINQSTIAEYERGTNLIATYSLYSICKKYNISADYLLGRIDKNTIN